MADKVTVKVDLHNVEEDLITLGPRIAKRVFRRLLNTLGKLWVEDVKSHVPVLTGELRDSIDFKVVTSPKNDFASLEVGPTYDSKASKKSGDTSQSPGVYGMFVEFGLKTKEYPKQPYMRPTFDTTAEQMVELFADGLREELEEAVKK